MRTFLIVVYEVVNGKVQGWPVNVVQVETSEPIRFFNKEGDEFVNLVHPDTKEMDS